MQQENIWWKKDLLLFSIYLCFFLFLTSCEDLIIPDPPPNPSGQTPDTISENLVVRIYFDASVSMQGFVVPNSTQYKNILRPLESVITSSWKNGKTEFFSFGENVQKIDRDRYLSVGSVDFYVEWRTYIQKIFEYEQQLVKDKIGINNTSHDSLDVDTSSNDTNDSTEENHIVVIVTDLFQDRRDVNLLVSQLKEKYIKQGVEVGLLGLRSEFDGKVYNLGTAPLPYRNKSGNPETFRPFYLLVIGKHADIAHYFDRLMANGFTDAQTIIFSRYLVNPILSFEDVTPEFDNLIRDTIAEERDPRVKEYRITNRDESSTISTKLKLILLPHVISFVPEEFDISIDAEHRPDTDGINEVSLDAQRCLQVTSTHFENDDSTELSVDFNLDSGSLLDRRIYLYSVTLRPDIDSFKEPDWCSEWDMGDERNGAKTLNLLNFVRDLTQVTVVEHEPIIAKFHFYIEKR